MSMVPNMPPNTNLNNILLNNEKALENLKKELENALKEYNNKNKEYVKESSKKNPDQRKLSEIRRDIIILINKINYLKRQIYQDLKIEENLLNQEDKYFDHELNFLRSIGDKKDLGTISKEDNEDKKLISFVKKLEQEDITSNNPDQLKKFLGDLKNFLGKSKNFIKSLSKLNNISKNISKFLSKSKPNSINLRR